MEDELPLRPVTDDRGHRRHDQDEHARPQVGHGVGDCGIDDRLTNQVKEGDQRVAGDELVVELGRGPRERGRCRPIAWPSGSANTATVEPSGISVAGITAEPLQESLQYWMKKLELPASVSFAPFNQVFQQLLDPSSLLSSNPQGLNVVLVRLEDWENTTASGAQAEEDDNVQRSVNDFILALKSAAARQSTPYLICISPPSARITADPERLKHLVRVERAIAAELESVAGVYVVRPEDLFRWYPVPEYHDASAEELGRFAWDLMAAQGQFVVKDGKPIETPEENLAELTRQAREFIGTPLAVCRALQIA